MAVGFQARPGIPMSDRGSKDDLLQIWDWNLQKHAHSHKNKFLERPEWIQKSTNCVKKTQCWISFYWTTLRPPLWPQPKGKGPRVYPCIFGTCIFKTVVATQKATFNETAKRTRKRQFGAPRVDSKSDKLRQKDAMLYIDSKFTSWTKGFILTF